jgi:hypothetical protein
MNLLNLYSNSTSYRGVSYNPNEKKATEMRTFVETYRGIKHEETKEVIK